MSSARLELDVYVGPVDDTTDEGIENANAAAKMQLEIDLDIKGYSLERFDVAEKFEEFGGVENVWRYVGIGLKNPED